jgi:hypothetical protein
MKLLIRELRTAFYDSEESKEPNIELICGLEEAKRSRLKISRGK